jgi:hypothetical protein
MSGPLSLPDDTIEFDVDRSADRPAGLMIGIGVLTLLVLVGLGYLVFGNLTGGGDGSGVGLGGPGGPTSVGGPPSDSPSPADTGTTPVPVAATTPASTPPTTPSRTPTPSASTSTVAVSLAIAGGAMKPQSYTGAACPAATLAQATVVAGGPVTITYHWTYAVDGKPGALPPTAYQFTSAGSHQFAFQPPALAEPSGRLTATFVVTAPVTRRASMLFTQECGASASAIVMTPAHPKCGDKVTLSSTMSAGVGPMQISHRWRIPGVISHPSIQPWDVPVGGGQQSTFSDSFQVAKGMTVTLTLDRVLPVPPAGRDVSFQTSIILTCTK